MANRFRPSDLGFSPSVVRSWDAALRRDARVLVPVHVDALVARAATAGWADCRMRTPDEGGSSRSIDLLPDPFANLGAPRPTGVHLHWAMPDGLANVRPAGSTASTPALPDRWLVARIGPDRRGARAVTAWVLDARDAIATPLDGWTATPPAGAPVTVLGIGDAGWAAYYDNVANRFAFHDPLAGVDRGRLAYLVCGWYADASQDPLAVALHSLAAFQAHLAALGWDLPEGDYARAQEAAATRISRAARAGMDTPHAVRDERGDVLLGESAAPLGAGGAPLRGAYDIAATHWPRATLFHGAVVGLSWPDAADDSPEVGGPPDAASIAVAVGATPADALAALVARATGRAAHGEWLTAFALGALAELQQPDGVARLDDALHEAAFASRSDGTEHVRRSPAPLPAATPRTPGDGAGAGARAARARGTADGADVVSRAVESQLSVAMAAEASAVSAAAMWRAKVGRFHEVHVAPPARGETTELPTEFDLPKPRLFLPAEPVIAIQGGHRSFKHGGDGRFTHDGRLMCRLSGTGVSALSFRVSPAGATATVRGAELLERPLAHGGIPPECEELLEELGLLDLGSAPTISGILARATPGAGAAAIARVAATEQTAWWALRSPDVDSHALAAHSGFAGRLPSPVAVRPPQKPWVPLHLDWEVEYIPTPASSWTPGEIDFAPPAVPDAPGERVRGRALLSAGVASSLAQSLRRYVSNEAIAGGFRIRSRGRDGALADLATELERLDALAGPLEHFHLALRRGVSPDAPAGTAAPPGFGAVRAGFLRITRLRLVDAFGQVLYLAGSEAEPGAEASSDRIAVGTGMDVPARPGVVALPPRFTAPAKISLRFRDPDARATDASADRSPVCGWVLPDHLDRALEFFDRDGAALGQLRADPEHGAVWDHVPGIATPVGALASDVVPHPELGGMAEALRRQSMADAAAGRTPALLELLRVIDSTRWTVDPFAQTGEEHLALLIGHPIAVVCASLTLEVREPAAPTDVPVTRVPVRLGALTHWQDGLFGYFVGGDFRRFRCAAAAAALARPGGADGFLGPIGAVQSYAAHFADDVAGGAGATPVEHPYIDASGLLWVVPGVEYPLLCLLEPHCRVHATTGLLPRKSLALPREWMAPALARLAPTFRFGPVLRDPQTIRMPIPSDIGAAWTWTHRADVDRWAEEEVVHAGHEALLPPDPAVANEGWLRMTPLEPEASAGDASGSPATGGS